MEFNEEEYIKNVVKELNKNCVSPNKYEWEEEDVNLDYSLCRLLYL
jgi:hypothetical protein